MHPVDRCAGFVQLAVFVSTPPGVGNQGTPAVDSRQSHCRSCTPNSRQLTPGRRPANRLGLPAEFRTSTPQINVVGLDNERLWAVGTGGDIDDSSVDTY